MKAFRLNARAARDAPLAPMDALAVMLSSPPPPSITSPTAPSPQAAADEAEYAGAEDTRGVLRAGGNSGVATATATAASADASADAATAQQDDGRRGMAEKGMDGDGDAATATARDKDGPPRIAPPLDRAAQRVSGRDTACGGCAT